jgi:ribose-phosphate pyrophosphokinase
MKVVGAQRSQMLASRIAARLGADLVDTTFSRFPDGELYVQTGRLDRDSIIVGSLVDSDSFVQLLLLIDAAADAGCECTLVLPYMGYARQDRQFKLGEALSARAVAAALSRGIRRVFTVNIHKESVLAHFSVPSANLSLAEDIGAYIEEQPYDDPLILAPDKGASVFAAAVARVGGNDADFLQKVRLSGAEVRMEPVTADVEGRTVVIVDDIISTGGTIATAAGMLYAEGAAEVHAACVHGVFAGGAYSHLKSAGIRKIAASDTIECGPSHISAAERIAEAIRAC